MAPALTLPRDLLGCPMPSADQRSLRWDTQHTALARSRYKGAVGAHRNLVGFCNGSNYPLPNTAGLEKRAGALQEAVRLSPKRQRDSAVAVTAQRVQLGVTQGVERGATSAGHRSCEVENQQRVKHV